MEDQTQMNASASICTSITCLPREILVKILTGLPAKCAVRLRCSCKFLYSHIPEPRLAFRISFVLPSTECPALRLYSVRYSEESHGRLQAVDSAKQLDSQGLEWTAGSSCGDGKMCMLDEETGDGALFDLSTGRRISLPRHRVMYFGSDRGSIVGNRGDFVVRPRKSSSSCAMVCCFAAVGFDSGSGRYKVFKSAVYDDGGRALNRQWVLTLEVDKSWREIRRPTTTGYTDAAVHIRGVIYYIPQISDESSYIVAMDVARERFMRLIPFPSEYESPQRERERRLGWVPWINLNGRLAFINIVIPAESKIEIWTLEMRSMEMKWGKQTVVVPLEESEAIGEAAYIGFTCNSMGEIVLLLSRNTRLSPLILVYSFRRDVWRRVEMGGVSKNSLYLSDIGGVMHINDEIAAAFWNTE